MSESSTVIRVMNVDLLALVRKPFEMLDDVTTDETTGETPYSGARTECDGLYAITNTQPGTGVYAAEQSRNGRTAGVTEDVTTGRRVDCVDPESCPTC